MVLKFNQSHKMLLRKWKKKRIDWEWGLERLGKTRDGEARADLGVVEGAGTAGGGGAGLPFVMNVVWTCRA